MRIVGPWAESWRRRPLHVLAPAVLGLSLGLGLAYAVAPRYRAAVVLAVEPRPLPRALSPATAEAMLHRRLPAIREWAREAAGGERIACGVEVRVAGADRVELECVDEEPVAAVAGGNRLAALLVERGEAEASRTPPDTDGVKAPPALVFRVVGPAGAPERTFPLRWLFSLVGLAAGLGAGLGSASLAEARDRSIRSPEEIEALLHLPVLAAIPFVPTRRRRR